MQTLFDLLNYAASSKAPPLWATENDRVHRDFQIASKFQNTLNFRVYGTNTLTGHRDGEEGFGTENIDINAEILSTHAISYGENYCAFEVKCISYAKLYSLAAGYTGIDTRCYRELQELCVRTDFNPLIPKGSSYSCGDVIPAAHWARNVFERFRDKNIPTPQGTAMALINGAFVHIGLAAASVKNIEIPFAIFLENSIAHAQFSNRVGELYYFSNAERSWPASVMQHVRAKVVKRGFSHEKQSSVSIRAIPQELEAFCVAAEDYMREINLLIFKPSGNPLFVEGEPAPLSQASFFCPTLSIKTGALIEAILFCAWAVVQRVIFILSGDTTVPIDGGDQGSPLGLIQIPKLMMGKLEAMRSKYGSRCYSSGGQTSYGIEDLWTHGVGQVENLIEVLGDFSEISILEAYVLAMADKKFDIFAEPSKFIKKVKESAAPADAVALLRDDRLLMLLEESLEQFPTRHPKDSCR
ncbi:aromatic amino acid lyase [Zhongshania arctica]|uniref:Aromatic amino acid lyase n=1 Tax=Zhongshania arctica TaxID=3238302 RepID=A0ABV3U009_9GAMM